MYYPTNTYTSQDTERIETEMPARTKELKHPRYFRIAGYQIVNNLSDEYIAKKLGCSVRTYRDKINGGRDFTVAELIVLSELFDRPAQELISTK